MEKPPTRVWGRVSYGLDCVLRRERDDLLGERLRYFQEKLVFKELSDLLRVIVGVATIDIPPMKPRELGAHVAALNADFRRKREEYAAEHTESPEGGTLAARPRLSKLSASLDVTLFSTIAIVHSFRPKSSRSDAVREVLEHGVELLEVDDERVGAFLEAAIRG